MNLEKIAEVSSTMSRAVDGEDMSTVAYAAAFIVAFALANILDLEDREDEFLHIAAFIDHFKDHTAEKAT